MRLASLTFFAGNEMPVQTGVSKVFLWVLLGLFITIGVWDIYVATHPNGGKSVSEQTRLLLSKWPELGFLLGFICGHIFSGK